MACPIPMGEKMNQRFGGPLALIKIITVFGKTAHVENTGI